MSLARLAFGWLAVTIGVACSDGDRPPSRTAAQIESVLRSDAEGFARALEPAPLEFPRDHGPHPAFRTEWWYFTGHLATPDDKRFGFHLTFFRSALAPRSMVRESAWGTTEIYMAHFAITDIEGGVLHSFERFSRAALGLAGAAPAPFAVWLEDWSARADGPGFLPLTLHAEQDSVSLQLKLRPGKPMVLQGDGGWSQKSANEASYYYSYTRLGADGTVRIGDDAFAVTGDAWCDREWSTSSLGADQVGWDWFALQLSDGWDLMFYRLRRADGSTDNYSGGVLVPPDGGDALRLGSRDLQIDVLDHWTSPDGVARYPAAFRLRTRQLDLRLSPLVADQEMKGLFRYWEGAVAVDGQHRGRQIAGRGYVELTGYAHR